MRPLVLDTNVALDLLVFANPSAAPVLALLAAGSARWIATAAMREELHRVLDYPQVRTRLVSQAVAHDAVLARFDALSTQVDAAAKAPCTCTDSDDQKFVDLAVAHRAVLLSKDRAVLALRKRLALLQVHAAPALAAAATVTLPRTDPRASVPSTS